MQLTGCAVKAGGAKRPNTKTRCSRNYVRAACGVRTPRMRPGRLCWTNTHHLDLKDEEGPLLASDEPWDDMCETSSSNFVSDSMWVYSRIGISGVEPHDAPSAGAWALLQWARKNQDTFFEKLMPRSLQLSEKHLAESRMVAEENVAIASLEEAMARALQGPGIEKFDGIEE